MTVVTLKGLPPAASIKLFPAAKVDEWCRNHTQPPAAWAVDTQVASATGDASFNVADNIEFMAVLPDGNARRIMAALTQVVDP